jgi:DNA-binding IclR family transcriptional regulator
MPEPVNCIVKPHACMATPHNMNAPAHSRSSQVHAEVLCILFGVSAGRVALRELARASGLAGRTVRQELQPLVRLGVARVGRHSRCNRINPKKV